MESGLRYFGGAVAFGFAAVWIMASLAAALVCLLAAAAGYGAVFGVERARAKLAVRAGSRGISAPSMLARQSQTREEGDMPRRADELNRDLGHVYEPPATTPPPVAPAEHGRPSNDDTATAASETSV